MKGRAVLSVFCALMLFVGCGKKTDPGQQTSEDRTVKPFTKVSLSGVGSIFLTQGDSEKLTVKAGEYAIGSVVSEVSDDTLKLELRPRAGQLMGEVEFHIQVKELEEVTISGDGALMVPKPLHFKDLKVTLNGKGTGSLNLQGDAFVLTVNGAGFVEAMGAVKEQEIVFSGAGEYEAPKLQSEEVSVTINGAAKVAVAPSSSLEVTIRGGGEVYYVGDPKVEQKIIGGGRVAPIEQRPSQQETRK